MKVGIACRFFMHWPRWVGFTEKHEVHELTANIDLLPTLIDLCDLEVSSSASFPRHEYCSLIEK